MEKECERIDRNVTEKDPPVIINNGQPKINTRVDASCNVLCMSYLFYGIVGTLYVLQFCGYVSEMSGPYNIPSADTTGEAPSGKS